MCKFSKRRERESKKRKEITEVMIGKKDEK